MYLTLFFFFRSQAIYSREHPQGGGFLRALLLYHSATWVAVLGTLSSGRVCLFELKGFHCTFEIRYHATNELYVVVSVPGCFWS